MSRILNFAEAIEDITPPPIGMSTRPAAPAPAPYAPPPFAQALYGNHPVTVICPPGPAGRRALVRTLDHPRRTFWTPTTGPALRPWRAPASTATA